MSEVWTSWEVCSLDGKGKWRQPVSEQLVSGCGDRPGKIMRTALLLEEGGFPPHNRRLDYEPADDKSPRIYRLKAKPTCWRLYFYADRTDRRFIYALAVCKQKDKRDPNDSVKARQIIERFLAGEGQALRLRFSPD